MNGGSVHVQPQPQQQQVVTQQLLQQSSSSPLRVNRQPQQMFFTTQPQQIFVAQPQQPQPSRPNLSLAMPATLQNNVSVLFNSRKL